MGCDSTMCLPFILPETISAYCCFHHFVSRVEVCYTSGCLANPLHLISRVLHQWRVAHVRQQADWRTRYVIQMPPIEMEPVFRTTMTRYMANTTFTHFQGFAHRFCNCVKGLVETSPSRHPEVFPVSLSSSLYRKLWRYCCWLAFLHHTFSETIYLMQW